MLNAVIDPLALVVINCTAVHSVICDNQYICTNAKTGILPPSNTQDVNFSTCAFFAIRNPFSISV